MIRHIFILSEMESFGIHVGIPRKTGVIADTPLTAMAFFVGSNQSWAEPKWTAGEISRFRTSLAKCPNLSPDKIVVHGCYLINPASSRDDVRDKSTAKFLQELAVCEQLGVGNYVFHPGSTRDSVEAGLDLTIAMIQKGLEATQQVNILVENMTKTNSLGSSFQQLSYIISKVNHSRVGVCLDTAHAWGEGLRMDSLLDDLDSIVGIQHLKAVHLNDSKAKSGSKRDLHADLFIGEIPADFWPKFVFDSRVQNLPAILETPSNCQPVLAEYIKCGGKRNIPAYDPDEEICD